MNKSHVLNDEGAKRLEIKHETDKPQSRTPFKEWDSLDEYYNSRKERLAKRNSKWSVRIKNFFKYSIGWRVRVWWYNIKFYFKNLILFQSTIYKWRPWSYEYQVDLFSFGLEQLANYLEKYGHEENASRTKKIEAIRSLIEELKRDYEEELRKKQNRPCGPVQKVIEYDDGSVEFDYDESETTKRERESYNASLAQERLNHYNKIFALILGQNEEELQNTVKERLAKIPEKERSETLYYQSYTELFDGSGIEGWWD